MVFTRGDLWPSHHEALCVLTWLVCWVHQLAQRCTWMWAAGTCRAHRDAGDAEAAPPPRRAMWVPGSSVPDRGGGKVTGPESQL